MAYGALRAQALSLNLAAHGLPATVTRPAPDATPISTSVVWVTPDTDDLPSGAPFGRREAREVAVLSRLAVPTCPIGTRIVAARIDGEAAQGWRVEGTDRSEPDHHRVFVVADPSALF